MSLSNRPGAFNERRVANTIVQTAVADARGRAAERRELVNSVVRTAAQVPAAPLAPLSPVSGVVTRTAPAPTAVTPSTTTPPAGGMTPGWESQPDPVGTFPSPVDPPPAAPIMEPAPTGAIITTTATPPAAPKPLRPMSIQFGSGPAMRSQFSGFPGVGGGVNPNLQVIGRAVSTGTGVVEGITQGVNEIGAAINTVRGWFGGGRSSAPSIPAQAMPGAGAVATAGFMPAGTIARTGAAVGRAVGRLAGSKKVRGVVGGVLGWWLVDKVTGAILGPSDPPRRRMNHLNPKALARANKRVCGFRDIAVGTLKQYGYTVSSSRSPRSCKPRKKRSCR